MVNSERIQHLIHALEVGALSRRLHFLPLAVAVIGLAVLYDLNSYRGFNSMEAMDAAQVARHVAEGNGYTTDFIRPFSVYLLQKHNHEIHAGEIQTTNAVDFAESTARIPTSPMRRCIDGAGGMMKMWKPDWLAETHKPFWSEAAATCAIGRNSASPFSTSCCCCGGGANFFHH